MKANLLWVVRSALARTRPVSAHPDANLLAAFAENTLLARERADVAGHLADCAECREFLALAFGVPEVEPAIAVQARVVRRWSPVWNWAASMAAVCIVVSAVWEFRAQRVPRIEPPPGPPEITATVPATPVVVAGKTENRRPAEPRGAAHKDAPRVAAAPPPAAAKQETADAISTPSPPPPPPEAFQSSQQVTVQPAPQSVVQEEKGAAPAARARTVPGVAMKAARGAVGGFAAMSRPAPALWSIASGTVRRSDDGGVTWKTVAINDQVGFSAVINAGSDVWAGGSAGALFHSADYGAHWERVALDATGTIVDIAANSSGDVRVTTDTHEPWVSLDRGRTWRLMPAAVTPTEDTPH